ncbi:MAG: NADH pyrophosphatase, partial [Alphaproteobacteria bacterium]|nr:NADH pyrophosphatase [Alphaproteobacteria bacterium]
MPLNPNNIFFSGNPLDRAGNQRTDDEWVAQKKAAQDTLFVPFWHLRPLILPEAQAGLGRDVGWLPRAAFGELLSVNSERLCVFLGLNRRGKALFAVDISDASQPEDAGPFKGLGLFEDLRELAMAGDMPPTELAIMAQGKSMVDWHLRHRFCSACGGETGLSEGGYKRNCGACGSDHFPRTDPVVIMLATHDDACLVGRQEAWG